MAREDPASGPETPKRHLLPWVIAMLLIAAIAVIAWQSYQAPRGLGLLRTIAVRWSAVYFGCLFFSAACAALAGVVIKLEFLLKNEAFKKDMAAVLAMLAALLVTLSTAGGFHQKWWANRLAAAKMEKLGYAFITADWTDKKATLDAFSAQIQAISYERNEEIVSSDSGTAEPGKTK